MPHTFERKTRVLTVGLLISYCVVRLVKASFPYHTHTHICMYVYICKHLINNPQLIICAVAGIINHCHEHGTFALLRISIMRLTNYLILLRLDSP
jgi:hypothetical protein